jgi:hypothetical protein
MPDFGTIAGIFTGRNQLLARRDPAKCRSKNNSTVRSVGMVWQILR